MLNPLGIQRSLDGGETLEEIAFQGETDFHAIAAGYNSHDIFLLNPAENSLLEAGFYKSNDQGESWEPVSAAGLAGEVTALALHRRPFVFGSFGTTAALIKYTIENEELETLNIPDLPEDAIAFIAQNPNEESELAIYTLQGQAYLSKDESQTWKALLQDEKTD